MDLAFHEVSEIIELSGDACNATHFKADGDLHSLIVGAERMVAMGNQYHIVQPERIIAFSAWPGFGSEPANVGLALYPGTISVLGKAVRTGIKGWWWESLCETHHASEEEYGGIRNFVRCHMTVVKLLDYAGGLEILGEVCDATGYWTNRNVEALGESVQEWNRQTDRMEEDMRRLLEDDDLESS